MPRVQPPAPPKDPNYEITVELLNDFRDFWVNKMKESGVDPVQYSRLSVVALTQLAAVLGVDVGMTPEQFVGVCQANFRESFKKAPRFG